MHTQNIMHRDLKPANILCDEFADQGKDEINVKIADFGLAIKSKPGEKRRCKVGTFIYMAPEQLDWKGYDFKVDVWALGCIAFNLLTGQYAYNIEEEVQGEEALERLKWQINNTPPNFAGLSKTTVHA